MSRHLAVDCTTCHGTMADVGDPARDPWRTEPRCDNALCHGAGYAPDQELYRKSRGHGGIYCEGCHDSTHAIAPSREPADGLKFVALQGTPDTLRTCAVCHSKPPRAPFSHRWLAP